MIEFNYKPLWEETLKSLKKNMDDFSSIYLDSLEYKDSKENCLILATPSLFFRDQIMQKYSAKIEKDLFSRSNIHISLQIDVDTSIDTDDDKEDKETKSSFEKEEKVQEIKNNGQHPNLNEKYTFENFVIGSGNSYAANAALAVANNPGQTAYNPLLIYGGVGLGKTHLLQAIGNHVYKHTKLKVLYVTSETFINDFIQSVNNV